MVVGIIQDIDAGKVRTDRGSGTHRELVHRSIGHDGDRPATALDVGDPMRRMTHHRRNDAPLEDEQAKIAEPAVALDPEKALQIVDAGDGVRIRKGIGGRDQTQVATLRSEQRLEDKRPA